MYLYDPMTNQTRKTTAKEMSEMTGQDNGSIRSFASRRQKLKKIGVYLSTTEPTIKERREWYAKEIIKDEAWVEVQGSDGQFLISNYGRVQRVYKHTMKFILPFQYKDKGFLQVKVRMNGKYKEYKVSQLVAMHFLGPIPKGASVFHKNGIKTDNFAGNLEYLDKSEVGKRTGYKAKSRAVTLYEPKTKAFINEYRSVREAARNNPVSIQAIYDHLNGLTPSAAGMMFMYSEDYEAEFGTAYDLPSSL